jgi:hypothetical protein
VGPGVARGGNYGDIGFLHRPGKRVPEVVGGDTPLVRGEIDQRVDQLPAGALLRERADQAVGVDPVGGAEIDDTKHRLVRKLSRGGQHGRVGGLERSALRERVLRVVHCHARELRAIYTPIVSHADTSSNRRSISARWRYRATGTLTASSGPP